MGLVITTAFSIFLFNNKMYKKSSSQYDVQNNTRNAIMDISKTVRYATEVEILNDIISVPLQTDIADNEGYIYYDFDNSSIVLNTNTSMSSYNIGKDASNQECFSCTPNSFTISVDITGTDGDEDFQVCTEILCLNLQLNSVYVSGDKGCILHYKKNFAI